MRAALHLEASSRKAAGLSRLACAGFHSSAPHTHASVLAALSALLPKGWRSPLTCFPGLPAGFNISAPHMHATVLEALDLQPGQDFLDVSC